MSIWVLRSAWEVLPEIGELIAAVPAKRRPNVHACQLVHLRLADTYRDERGHANESVKQLMATLSLTDSTARAALDALEHALVWRAVRRGGPGAPTQRVPAFVLPTGLRGADPAQLADLVRGVRPAPARGQGSHSAGPAPRHPSQPRVTPRPMTAPRIVGDAPRPLAEHAAAALERLDRERPA